MDSQPSIWFREPDLDQVSETNAETMVDHLGIQFVEFGPDFTRATMPVDRRTVQPFGILHGGASAALAETVASYAGLLCIDQTKYVVAGIELNINHVRSERSGVVTARCHAVHLGRSTHIWSVRITNSADQLVAISRVTLAVLEKR